MNLVHKTKSGTVTLVGKKWRDGAFPLAKATVACLTVHDDVENAVWRYTGKKRDAAETVGRLYVGTRERIARLSFSHIEIESSDQHFDPPLWIVTEPGDDVTFNAAAHPDVVAY